MAWLSGYSYRKPITIAGSSAGVQTNYQLKVNVRRATGTDASPNVFVGSKCLETFNDIRFTQADGTTELDHWLESDGVLEWASYASNPIISPEGGEDHITFGSTLYVGTTYHHYYMYHDGADAWQIGHATSTDGKIWTKDAANNPVFVKGASGKFDDTHVRTPMVWKEGSTWHMIYTGDDGGGNIAIGYATSSDGISWTRQNSGNAVLSGTAAQWDANDVENWGIIKVGSTYYLWYSKISATRQIGLATSTDLINWTKDANNPIFGSGRFCPFPFKYGSNYYLIVPHYSSGSDHSEFELYRDVNPTFYSASRTLLGICKMTNIDTTTGWDSNDEDTPCVLTDDIERDSFTASGGELWVYYSGQLSTVWKTGMLIETNLEAAINKTGVFWVEVNSIPASPDTVVPYIYYGDADASSASNGDNTFIFFDHFPNTSLDLAKWSVSAGDVGVSGSVLTLTGTTGTRGVIYTDTTSGINCIVRSRLKTATARNYNGHFVNLQYDASNLIYIYGLNVDQSYRASTTSGGSNSTSDFSLDDTVYFYRIHELSWKTNEVKYYQNGTLKVTKITNIPADQAYAIWLREGSTAGQNIYIDWILRRKWVDPEPTISAFGAEELPSSASVSPSSSPSVSPSMSPSRSPSSSPSGSPSLSYSASPSGSPSASPSMSPSPSPSRSPSISPSASPSKSPSESPSLSPSASASPSRSPSPSPSNSPSLSSSTSPSASPSMSPSQSFSESPSISPSRSPSASPSLSPSASVSPSASPSTSPSGSPSVSPSPEPDDFFYQKMKIFVKEPLTSEGSFKYIREKLRVENIHSNVTYTIHFGDLVALFGNFRFGEVFEEAINDNFSFDKVSVIPVETNQEGSFKFDRLVLE